jgi:hypothetical protein
MITIGICVDKNRQDMYHKSEEMLVEREHCQKKAQAEDLFVERDQGNQKKAH